MHAVAKERQHRDISTAQCALCVLSVLLLVLGILLGSALSPLLPSRFQSQSVAHTPNGDTAQRPNPYSESDQPLNNAGDKEDNSSPSTGPATRVLYRPESVAAQALEVGSRSLTGCLCEQEGCASQSDGWPNSLFVTADNRLVTTDLKLKTISVYSETGVDVIRLKHQPYGLAQLSSGLLAATCPLEKVILIVDIDAEDHVIRKIRTKKPYASIALGPDKETLLVASTVNVTIDVIPLQGGVIRTLVDSASMQDMYLPVYLGVHERKVTVCAYPDDEEQSIVIRFRLSDTGEIGKVDSERLLFPVNEVSVDKAGNMFIMKENGQVVLTTQDGGYRRLLQNPNLDKYFGTGIVVHGDRLVAAWYSDHFNSSLLMEYTLSDE